MTISKNESTLLDWDFERRINLDFIAKNGGDFLLTVCIERPKTYVFVVRGCAACPQGIEREGSLISPVSECAACLQGTERF
jgi:hypothetical protein